MQLITTNSFARWVERNVDESRVCSLLAHAIHADPYSSHPASSRIVTDALNYLTNRSDGTISFLPKGRELEYVDETKSTWSRKGRQEGRPAKVIQKLFAPHVNKLLKPRDWEKFSALYQAACITAELNVYEGEDIQRAYRGDYGAPTFGSCMNGCFDEVEFYADAPVKLYTLTENNELKARALVWFLPDKTVADRIYSGNDKYREALKIIFEERGYYTRAYDSFQNKDEFISPSGERVNLSLGFHCPDLPASMPYLDTLSYAYEHTRGGFWITNDPQCDWVYRFDQTDGQSTIRRKCYGRPSYVLGTDPNDFTWSEYHNAWLATNDAYTAPNGMIFHDSVIVRKTVVLADRLPEAIADVSGRYYIEISRMRTRTLVMTPEGNFLGG